MLTNQLVSNFRAAYALFADEHRWTDRYIVSMFNIARAKLLHDKAKRDRVKRTNFVGFCMPLCLGKPLECPCIAEAQCYALVGKYDLPDYIDLEFPFSGLEIRTGDGQKLDMWSPREARLAKLNPALKNKAGYWVENYRGDNKLVIFNKTEWQYIYVTMLPTDLDQIIDIPACSDDGVDTGCPDDWTTEEYPLDANLIFDLFRLTDNMLKQQYRTVEDDVNDTKDELNNN